MITDIHYQDSFDIQYQSLLDVVLSTGFDRSTRNAEARSITGYRLSLSSDTFPLLTLRKINSLIPIVEVIWRLKGESTTKLFHDYGLKIWDKWANERGELGPVYGFEWHHWGGLKLNQLEKLEKDLKDNRHSRRMVLTSWSPDKLPDERLTKEENLELGNALMPSCPLLVQFNYIHQQLDCVVYQRSADLVVGLPIDVVTYKLLQMIICYTHEIKVGKLEWFIGDAHVYNDHIPFAKRLIETRKIYDDAHVRLKKKSSILDYEVEDIFICDYQYIQDDYYKKILKLIK